MDIFTPDHTNSIGCTSAGQKCAFRGFTCLVIGCVRQHVSAHLYQHASCWQEDKEITQILCRCHDWLPEIENGWLLYYLIWDWAAVLSDLLRLPNVIIGLFPTGKSALLCIKTDQSLSCSKYFQLSLCANNPEGGATANSQSLKPWEVITNK